MVDLSIVFCMFTRSGNPHLFNARSSFFWGKTNAHQPTIAWWSPEECNLMEGADGYLHDAEDCAKERRLAQTGQWKVFSKKRRWKNGNSSSPNGRFYPWSKCINLHPHLLWQGIHIYMFCRGLWCDSFFLLELCALLGCQCDSYCVKTPWAAGCRGSSLDLEMSPDFTIFTPEMMRKKSRIQSQYPLVN